jgi:hypothetical protein
MGDRSGSLTKTSFDQWLSVISVRNILIEILASQTIQRFKKNWKKNFKKFQTFFEKIYKLCRRGYAEGKAIGIDYAEGISYADGQIELRRGASMPRGYAEGSPRRRLRRRQLSLRRGPFAVGIRWNSCSAQFWQWSVVCLSLAEFLMNSCGTLDLIL